MLPNMWLPLYEYLYFQFHLSFSSNVELTQNWVRIPIWCVSKYRCICRLWHSNMIVLLVTGICGKFYCIDLLPECLSTVKCNKKTIDWLKSSEYASGQISAKELFICDWFTMFHVNYDEHFDWAYCQINSKFSHNSLLKLNMASPGLLMKFHDK